VSEGLSSSTDWHQDGHVVCVARVSVVVRCTELTERSSPTRRPRAIARTRFFVLYSVFKERPGRGERGHLLGSTDTIGDRRSVSLRSVARRPLGAE
jgi:hypothetical protein